MHALSDHSFVDASPGSSRRNFFTETLTKGAALSSLVVYAPASNAEDDTTTKVLVLGGTGFVGSRVCTKLKSLGVEVISTSRDGRDGTAALDFTDPSVNVSQKVEGLASECQAVISCVGSIGTTDDAKVNSGTGLAALGAKSAGTKRFIYISVAPEVRSATKGVSFLNDYMAGKTSSEEFIQRNFPSSFMLIEPTFIYGGDSFNLNPPRVATGYGKLVESILSSPPLRVAAGVSPGFIGVALEPPVSVDAVAGAAVAGALGYSVPVLDTYDKIVEASKSLNA